MRLPNNSLASSILPLLFRSSASQAFPYAGQSRLAVVLTTTKLEHDPVGLVGPIEALDGKEIGGSKGVN